MYYLSSKGTNTKHIANYLKLFVCIIFCISVSGCTPESGRAPKYQSISFDPKTKAVVIVGTKNITFMDLVRYTGNDAEDIEKYRVVKSNHALNLFGYTNSIYTVEAGMYYIDYAFYDHENSTYYTKAPGITADGEVSYGAFEVKPGEVVYLGDIEFNWLKQNSSNTNNIVSVTGDLKEVKQEIKASEHRSLAAKLAKGKFLPKGSKIVATNLVVEEKNNQG
jgi:hypothetical protein